MTLVDVSVSNFTQINFQKLSEFIAVILAKSMLKIGATFGDKKWQCWHEI